MKRHLNFCHAGLISVEEFCKFDGLTYIGTLVYKETDEIALDLGEVVSINGNYFATNISFLNKNGLTLSSLKCTRISGFNPRDFLLLDDCSIMIDIWDTSIADDGPIWSLAYEDSSLKRAQERIRRECDVDILVKDYLIEKHTFMKLSTTTSMITPITSKSA